MTERIRPGAAESVSAIGFDGLSFQTAVQWLNDPLYISDEELLRACQCVEIYSSDPILINRAQMVRKSIERNGHYMPTPRADENGFPDLADDAPDFLMWAALGLAVLCIVGIGVVIGVHLAPAVP